MEKKFVIKRKRTKIFKKKKRARFFQRERGTKRKKETNEQNNDTKRSRQKRFDWVVLFYSSRGCRRRARVKVKICVKMCFLCNYFSCVNRRYTRRLSDDERAQAEYYSKTIGRRMLFVSFRFLSCLSLRAGGIDRLFLFARNADAMEKLSLSLNTTLLPAQSSSSPALPDASGKKSSRYFRNFRTRRFEPRHGTRASTR